MYSRNVQALRRQLLELWDEKRQLTSVPGTVGEITKVWSPLYLSHMFCMAHWSPQSLNICHFFFSFQNIESNLSQLRWCNHVAHWINNHYMHLLQLGLPSATAAKCTESFYHPRKGNCGEWGDRWTEQFRHSLHQNWRHFLKGKTLPANIEWLLHIEVDFIA